MAVDLSDAVLLVVDGTVGATDTDNELVRLLRRSGKPVVLAANKVDGPAGSPMAAELWSLASGSRSRSPRCTAGGSVTCWTPSSRCCPRCPPSRGHGREGDRDGWRWWVGRTWASPRC